MKLGKMMSIQELETLRDGIESMVADLQNAIDNVDNTDMVLKTLNTLVFELKDNIMSVEYTKKHFEIRKELLED